MRPGIDDFVPSAPDWKLDWKGIDEAFSWVRAMRGSPHDPVHHQEGDVWIHTRMVVEALCGLEEWRKLPLDERRVAFAGALLHDVAKPATAVVDDVTGRVSNRGHSSLGARMARRILWEMDFPPHLRERVCAIVASHQAPFWLIERDYGDARRFLAARSLECGNHMLALMATADTLGRICNDQQRILDNIELFREMAAEEECLRSPFPFADDHTRFVYFHQPGTSMDPRWSLYSDGEAPEAVIMSGLPASGKSTWMAMNVPDLPRVSLDGLRAEMGIAADRNQGRVIQAAREAAREHLRAGRPFVWDGTNITRNLRAPLISLFADYGFRVRIVALEAPRDVLEERNRERQEPVPAAARESMLAKWEHPSPVEAHALESAAFTVGSAREFSTSLSPV